MPAGARRDQTKLRPAGPPPLSQRYTPPRSGFRADAEAAVFGEFSDGFNFGKEEALTDAASFAAPWPWLAVARGPPGWAPASPAPAGENARQAAPNANGTSIFAAHALVRALPEKPRRPYMVGSPSVGNTPVATISSRLTAIAPRGKSAEAIQKPSLPTLYVSSLLSLLMSKTTSSKDQWRLATMAVFRSDRTRERRPRRVLCRSHSPIGT